MFARSISPEIRVTINGVRIIVVGWNGGNPDQVGSSLIKLGRDICEMGGGH